MVFRETILLILCFKHMFMQWSFSLFTNYILFIWITCFCVRILLLHYIFYSLFCFMAKRYDFFFICLGYFSFCRLSPNVFILFFFIVIKNAYSFLKWSLFIPYSFEKRSIFGYQIITLFGFCLAFFFGKFHCSVY